jgi:ribosomal-protein-alanine N-acetyltransferase
MPRVSLRQVAPADAPALIAAHITCRDYHTPWVQPCTDQPGFDAWFEHLSSDKNLSLIARERNAGGIVGVVNFSQIVLGNFRSAYLGFYGMQAFAGQGLMTEALHLAAQHAFRELGLHRLEANIQPANTRSIALVRRVGFEKEGFSPKYLHIDGAWRDHERWAMLAEG